MSVFQSAVPFDEGTHSYWYSFGGVCFPHFMFESVMIMMQDKRT
jgi:hypothetical protein